MDHALYSKSNPYPSELLVNRLMTQGSDKETRHFELSLKDSGLEYLPGDSLGVLPVNCSKVVDDLLRTVGLAGDETVLVNEENLVLQDALMHRLACTVLSKIQIKKFNEIAESEKLAELLQISNKEALIEYMWGRELIDLFLEFPQSGMDAQTFIDLLRPMPPRLYSIASSLAAHADEVHLTVAVVRYDGHGRERKGVCSSYLAERVGERIPCYLHPNKNFKLPADPQTPIIMVGPGTGIAPFRAFLEERMATGASGKNWLFFGDRSQKTDYLYGNEWSDYQKAGVLSNLDLAWSRDQEDKVYVQHKMLEKKSELWRWIQEGAFFYVCGDASRMAKDVDHAIRRIASEEGSMTDDEASKWVKGLQKDRRYLKDVY
ncbi:MAG: protein CysJ [Verrucomicrobia bacterium TMED56]|nr:MAG: protein CysJ [Verrucomicrobia bacterium TMED56]